MEIINNTWFVGIIGGVISGIMVYFITDKIFSKKENKEYLQKILSANNEIIYTLRPLIAQKQIPTLVILESFIESVGRKYGVLRKDLLSIGALVDDLIREVMENAFLDTQLKAEYSNKIIQLKNIDLREKKIIDDIQKYSIKIQGKSEQVSISVVLGLVAGLTAISGSLVLSKNEIRLDGLSQIHDLGAITGTSIILPVLALIISSFIISKANPKNSYFLRDMIKKIRK